MTIGEWWVREPVHGRCWRRVENLPAGRRPAATNPPAGARVSRSGRNIPATALASGLAAAVLLAGCTTLPRDYPRTVTTAVADTQQTRLGRWVAPLLERHPGQSGVHPMPAGKDAFVARVTLADAAERSLDMQYFEWHADTTGKLLVERLLRAADRGVRVRLLLDDLHAGGYDRGLGMLDQHPNVEVRLFNPFGLRDARTLDYLTSFGRVNRRMHNKSFTADNQVAIVGGRNVGDEYYAAGAALAFRDLDLLAVGPVVPQVSAAFDEYWNSEFAVPMAVVAGEGATRSDIEERRASLAQHTEAARGSAYARALAETDMATALAGGALPFFWGQARVVFDRPGKAGADPGDRATHMGPDLRGVVERAASEVILVSPYFVPREEGVAFLSGLRQRGVRVRVLTNSLASTDLPVVHTGYAPYREDLLRAGVELYELKPTAHERGRRRQGDSAEPEAPGSAAQAGLHAKTFVVDRRIMFVGSFNLDPRSALLNTEMGVLLEIPALAESMADAFEKGLPEQAFRLELRPVQAAAGSADAAGSTLQWVAWEGGQEVRFDAEPFAGFWLRLKVWFLSLLPIEGQL